MAKYFVFSFPDDGAIARAALDEERAPRTVALLWARAPYSGTVGHAMHSGTSVALYIDPAIVLPVENATTQIETADLMFMHYDAGTRHGYPEPLSEIFWAYDRYCRPTMPGMLVPVAPNIFGRFLPGSEAFFAVSARTRHEGRKRLEISAATG